MTRLVDLVATSLQVAATPGRLAKVDALATLLRRLAPEEVDIAVAYLSGETRQGKLGLGYAALRDARGDGEARGEPLKLTDTDAAHERLRATSGKG
jgi:DNA ligase-1